MFTMCLFGTESELGSKENPMTVSVIPKKRKFVCVLCVCVQRGSVCIL